MIWLLLILLVPVAVFFYLLFAPFYMEVDSTTGLLQLRFHSLVTARLLMDDSSLIIEIKILGWKKRIDLFEPKGQKEKPVAVERQAGKRSKISFHKIKAIAASFKINTCYATIDFDDMEWNGILFPVFYEWSRLTETDCSVNFVGENEIKLQIENNIARIAWAYLFK